MKESLRNLFLVFSSVLLLFSLIYYFTRPVPPPEYHVNAYLRNIFDDNGHNPLKQGMEQAAIDFKVAISFSRFEEGASTIEKQRLFRQEIENGSTGILLEPDSEAVFEEITGEIPLVVVNNPFDNQSGVPVIAADNKKMGAQLAAEIQRGNSEKRPVLILHSMPLYAEEEENRVGMVEVFKQERVVYDQLNVSEKEWEGKLMAQIQQNDYFAIVCLGTDVSETVGKWKKNKPALATMQLYGFGFSNPLLNLVDQGIYQGLGVSNQFAVGYASVSQLIAQMEGETQRIPTIASLIVTKESLFNPDNQKLLFPLIQ